MISRMLKAAAVALPLAMAMTASADAQPAPTPFSLTYTFVSTATLEPMVTGVTADGKVMTTAVTSSVGWLVNNDDQWFGNRMGATCRGFRRSEDATVVFQTSNCTFVDRDGDQLYEVISRERGATQSTGQFTGGTGKYAGVVSEPFLITGFPALGRTLDGYSVSGGIKVGVYTGGTPPAQ